MEIGEKVIINIAHSIIPIKGNIILIEDGKYFIEDEQGSIFIEKTNKRLQKYMEAI